MKWLLTVATVVALAAAGAAWADNHQGKPGDQRDRSGMMRGGMMQGGMMSMMMGMMMRGMGQMTGTMDDCTAMMRDGDKPNDRWRKKDR